MITDLLPPSATPQERALSDAASCISNVPVPLRELWNPATCPSDLLPWLAWAMAVDSWDSTWSDETKRTVIANSLAIHRRKGTAFAVQQIVAPFGITVLIREWWQTGGTPYTFSLTFSSSNWVASVQQSILAAINAVKPVRAEMLVSNTDGFSADVNACCVLRVTRFDRLEILCQP